MIVNEIDKFGSECMNKKLKGLCKEKCIFLKFQGFTFNFIIHFIWFKFYANLWRKVARTVDFFINRNPIAQKLVLNIFRC